MIQIHIPKDHSQKAKVIGFIERHIGWVAIVAAILYAHFAGGCR